MNTAKRVSWETLVPVVLILLFTGSIVWINFHSAFWYDMDMALNSYLGGLMWKEKTFFPENWIFGNSFFIVESSNLAALFYGLTHQTTVAMSLASSLWVFIIVGTFIWCLKPFVSKKGLIIGILCLIGGIIFGTSAASYTKGLQVLYTMASYYACYLEVLLLTLGCWLRLYSGKPLHCALWALAILLNFAVGMHSLREMLILGIPLLALSGLMLHFRKDRKSCIRKASLLALLVLSAEALGYLLIKQFHIPASPNIGSIHTEWSIDLLTANFLNATKNLLRISGLAFIKDGLDVLPLFLCALCVAIAVVKSLIQILRKKDTEPLSITIVFAWVSLLAVFGTGTFFFKTRDIYFFLYWLLATLSCAYLIMNSQSKQQVLLTGAICLIAAVNYGYNFVPDFIDHHRYAPRMAEATKTLVDEGYTTLYGDDCAVFAAASRDQIVATPIRLNLDGTSDSPTMVIFPYNKDISLYDEEHARHAIVCLSNYYLDQLDESSLHTRMTSMKALEEFHLRNRDIILYSPQNTEPLFLTND